ncbi:hypothetical protein BT63DRAFT_424087 [Microthyrium microscopicum]|uniref:F-box domain-containing protein n=1 Tax=Microthyrium microscopicum TaxID=703497 RepID=A0A6A6UE91_9PEZI|nr:hypothetical protein BT63DRAFT_424087 [Microthyrium microscopicum]
MGRTLQDLPPELKLELIDHLDLDSKICLRLCSSFFFHMIPPATNEDLIAQIPDATLGGLNYLHCVRCKRFRSWKRFNVLIKLRHAKTTSRRLRLDADDNDGLAISRFLLVKRTRRIAKCKDCVQVM